MSGLWLNNHVHVVRHNHEAVEPVTFAVKMLQCIRDDLRNAGIAQNTLAVAFIQPFFRASDETRFIFARGLVIPRRWMKFQPRFQFISPLLQEILGNGICQSKRNKISGALLLPVRQMTPRHFERGVLIETAENRRLAC